MSKKYSINLLSKSFYNKYKGSVYFEILNKESRPYLILFIKIGNINYAIPFRSHIKHKYGYKLEGFKNKRDYAGLDFTKTIIVKNKNMIGEKAYISKNQYMRLNSEFSLLLKSFKKFLDYYYMVLKKKNRNKKELELFMMGTIKLFE